MLNYRDIAREWRDAASNSFAKKCETKADAVKYIKNLNYEVVDNPTSGSNVGKSTKRKRLDLPSTSDNSVEFHINKVFSIIKCRLVTVA